MQRHLEKVLPEHRGQRVDPGGGGGQGGAEDGGQEQAGQSGHTFYKRESYVVPWKE